MKGHFPEDHIAMMMQFLACLADESYEAFADGDDARVRELLGAQQAFVLAHVGEWLEAFNEELYRKDESGVFFQIGRIAARVCRVRRRFRRRVGCFGRAGWLTLWMRRSTLPHLTR